MKLPNLKSRMEPFTKSISLRFISAKILIKKQKKYKHQNNNISYIYLSNN